VNLKFLFSIALGTTFILGYSNTKVKAAKIDTRKKLFEEFEYSTSLPNAKLIKKKMSAKELFRILGKNTGHSIFMPDIIIEDEKGYHEALIAGFWQLYSTENGKLRFLNATVIFTKRVKGTKNYGSPFEPGKRKGWCVDRFTYKYYSYEKIKARYEKQLRIARENARKYQERQKKIPSYYKRDMYRKNYISYYAPVKKLPSPEEFKKGMSAREVFKLIGIYCNGTRRYSSGGNGVIKEEGIPVNYDVYDCNIGSWHLYRLVNGKPRFMDLTAVFVKNKKLDDSDVFDYFEAVDWKLAGIKYSYPSAEKVKEKETKSKQREAQD
jgi:hypothetical protein